MICIEKFSIVLFIKGKVRRKYKLYFMLCELSILFNIKEGVEEQFPEVVGNSHYEKLWHHLDKRELCNFGSAMECYATPWPLWRESRNLAFYRALL